MNVGHPISRPQTPLPPPEASPMWGYFDSSDHTNPRGTSHSTVTTGRG